MGDTNIFKKGSVVAISGAKLRVLVSATVIMGLASNVYNNPQFVYNNFTVILDFSC